MRFTRGSPSPILTKAASLSIVKSFQDHALALCFPHFEAHPPDTWQQMKTAYASGIIGLREIARNMGIPEGTVLARAKREGWTREIQNAKALAKHV